MRTLAGTCAAATMSQEGVEVGDGYGWAGGLARGAEEGPGARRGLRSFWGLHPKPRPTAWLALVPPPPERMTATSPG